MTCKDFHLQLIKRDCSLLDYYLASAASDLVEGETVLAMADQVESVQAETQEVTTEQPDGEFAKPRNEMSSNELEKLEEAKLKAKYPMASGFPISGHSAFLQKKLAKGKYFDSGDYQMAKQNTGASKARQAPQAILAFGTGEAIPTPESVPVRKTSIIQTKFTPSSTT
ncbi:endosulfine alpha isoform X2 [Lycorma delicatula]|uniref:endosulfine alpha isoform X2 n=1 Tax=Lycorma delicatula TaxID=130591 RepID=UPI003F50EC7D